MSGAAKRCTARQHAAMRADGWKNCLVCGRLLAGCGLSAGQVQKTAGRSYCRKNDTRYLSAVEVDRAATVALARRKEPCRPIFNMRRAK